MTTWARDEHLLATAHIETQHDHGQPRSRWVYVSGLLQHAPYTWDMLTALATTTGPRGLLHLARYWQQLTDEMGLGATSSTIRVDATVAERFLSQPLHTSQMRHVNTKLLFVREHVKARLYEFGHVDGTINPADALTKSLGGSTIEHLYGVVQSCNTHRPCSRKLTTDSHGKDNKRGRKAKRPRHAGMK